MRNVLSAIHTLLIVGLVAGFAGVSDAQANTSAEEVLKDIATEDIVDNTTVTDEQTEATEETATTTDDEAEPTPQAVEPSANDYGDAVLNALYSE